MKTLIVVALLTLAACLLACERTKLMTQDELCMFVNGERPVEEMRGLAYDRDAFPRQLIVCLNENLNKSENLAVGKPL